MSKNMVEKAAPKNYHVPNNIPKMPKFRAIVADPPWSKNQGGNFGAINHYSLMSLDRIKKMPVADLVDDNAHLWLWVTNGNIDEGLEVIKAWGFCYRAMYHWIKPRMGLGKYLRNASETCLFATRGKAPVEFRSQINWMIGSPTLVHSEKPREFISVVERVSPGPYCELFCRKRPASTEKWYCWGNETDGGADFFIPEYPVPNYSFDRNVAKKTNNAIIPDTPDISKRKEV